MATTKAKPKPKPKPKPPTTPNKLPPGTSWVDPQGDLWMISMDGQRVNLGKGFSTLLVPVEGAPIDYGQGTTTTQATDPGQTTGETTQTQKGEEPVIDWRSWLEDWGFDSQIIERLDGMSRRYDAAHSDMFVRDAVAYLRSTEWHKNMFVGFTEAVKSGLLTDERQYRQYVNGVNDAYKRYLGRDISSQELVESFRQAFDPQRVEGELQAGAYVKANRGDINYLFGAFDQGELSDDQLKSYGRQQVGIGNVQGQDLLSRVAKAQERLRRVFEGTLGTGSLTLQSGRLSSPSLSQNPSDIGR